MWRKAKLRLDTMLNPGDDDSHTLDSIIIVLIALCVIAVMLETEPETAEAYAGAFWVFEVFSSVFFTIEYVARLWVCTENPKYAHPLWGRLRYALTPMALIDLVAVLPFYAPMLIEMDLRIARAIRMFRLLRLLKMGRYAHAVMTMNRVLSRKKEELAMTLFILLMLLVLSASAIYFVEHEAQPEKFRSIPEAMWWAVVTLTSVGYGDVFPVTGLGKFLGAIISLLGVGFVALPTGILAAGFNEQVREDKRGKDSDVFGFCPHCGKQLIPGEELE